MRSLAVLAAVVLLTNCQVPPVQMTAEEEAAIAAEIDSLTVAWWEAWEVFDVERGLSFIHDAPETTWAGAGETLTSRQEMQDVWPSMVAGLERQDLEFTNSMTVVLSPDIVWTLREADYTVVDTTGMAVSEGQFIETAVWVNRGGEWKILLGHDDDATPVM